MRFDPAALFRARSQKGLTQEQLAVAAGTSFTTVNRLEGGKIEPTLATINKLASALEIDADELLIFEENGAPA